MEAAEVISITVPAGEAQGAVQAVIGDIPAAGAMAEDITALIMEAASMDRLLADGVRRPFLVLLKVPVYLQTYLHPHSEFHSSGYQLPYSASAFLLNLHPSSDPDSDIFLFWRKRGKEQYSDQYHRADKAGKPVCPALRYLV